MKVFLGLLRVLITIGPIMVVDLSASAILLRFAGHLDSRRVDYISD